jgi:hypothetical protein
MRLSSLLAAVSLLTMSVNAGVLTNRDDPIIVDFTADDAFMCGRGDLAKFHEIHRSEIGSCTTFASIGNSKVMSVQAGDIATGCSCEYPSFIAREYYF